MRNLQLIKLLNPIKSHEIFYILQYRIRCKQVREKKKIQKRAWLTHGDLVNSTRVVFLLVPGMVDDEKQEEFDAPQSVLPDYRGADTSII